MPLDAAKIAELYATKRTKGQYEDLFTHFMTESDEPGIDPKEVWPMELGSKNATTLYQGFRNAAEKLGVLDQVDVIQRDGSVFILHKDRVKLMLGVDSLPTENTEAVENSEQSTDTELAEQLAASVDNLATTA